MAKYLNEITGKGIPASVFLELFFYFSFNSTQLALPLAVLLSALMTYGSLGQHNELIAIKSSGISLVRIISPLFIAICLLAVADFYFNNTILPKTNIKAYSLLYDMKHKKPDFDLKEKVFYNGIPGYSVRVDKKEPETGTLHKVIIYDHSNQRGNTEVIVADSGKMYTILDGNYLTLELYNGQRSAEHYKDGKPYKGEFTRSKFSKSKMVFDLSSFGLNRTPEKLFSKNRKMLKIHEIEVLMDSLTMKIAGQLATVPRELGLQGGGIMLDTAGYGDHVGLKWKHKLNIHEKSVMIKTALNAARNSSNHLQSKQSMIEGRLKSYNKYGIEKLHNYTNAFACLIMFLIGAPLGVIIKKGGMGIPALITIGFFILYYIMSITGEKMTKALEADYYTGTWLSNVVLIPFAIFFIYLASKDAKVF